MIFEFLTDFKRQGEHHSVRDLKVIMKKYLKSNFIIDLIPLLPLPQLSRRVSYYIKELYLLKTIRILKGHKALNVEVILSAIKKFLKKKTELKIKNNALLADDVIEDHNHIDQIMYFRFIFKILKFVIILLNISYFVGMLWILYC